MPTKMKRVPGQFILFLAPALTIIIAAAFFLKVDLKPEITTDFFFASDSQIYRANKQISDVFPSRQQILLNVETAGSIADPNYIEKVGRITDRVKALKGITDVQSITNGPSSLDAARENPLWRRILIGEGEESSFIIAFVDTDAFAPLVRDVEKIVTQEENRWFKVRISGLPYIVEQIRRNLTEDMKVFTLGAVALSALVLVLVFRSALVVTGALVACIVAAMATLTIQSLFGISIGILTANLGTIVFVLTLTHVIFLTSNWCNIQSAENRQARLSETLAHTGTASFFAALTTLCGFASLIFVEAKPLNELGIGGAIGTVAALVCAYLIFPAFLRFADISPSAMSKRLAKGLPRSRGSMRITALAVIAGAVALGGVGLTRLNTDPSLLAYFDEGSELHNGLYYVDENGGSSPLVLVLRRDDAVKLDNGESYEKLWALQTALAEHEAVGSVISLPVIMAEGDSHWLGHLLPWNMLLDILSDESYGAIAKSFITPDRVHARFMLRMRESGRERPRLEIMEEIRAIPREHGFELTLTGGTYYLQGELSAAVARSMATGILTLLVIFGVIAWLVSNSLRVTAGVVTCAAVISALVLGTLGAAGIPVDIISSPAINICLGLIVDNMVHLTMAAKRRLAAGEGTDIADWAIWRGALDSQSWPAVVSTLAVMIGFSVFALSDFPPSRRFGLEITYGAGIAVILALVIFPYITSRRNGTMGRKDG
jgi:predicted RND superfamily exporter protein